MCYILGVSSQSLGSGNGGPVQFPRLTADSDSYQDLAVRPVRQKIQRLSTKDEFLGCAPSQRDEGVSEEEVGPGMGKGRLGNCRTTESTDSGVRQTQIPVQLHHCLAV